MRISIFPSDFRLRSDRRAGRQGATAALLLGPCALAAWAPAARADDATPANGKKQPTIEELQKRLDERDAVIQELLLRVMKLERAQAQAQAQAQVQAQATGRVAGAASAPPPSRAASAPAAVAPIPPRPAEAAAAAQTAVEAQASPPPAAPAAPPTTASSPPSSPPSSSGTFEVDPEAAEHALERALVQTGALLLPTGVYQIVPTVTYTRREQTVPGPLVLTTDGRALTSDIFTQQDQLETSLLFRAGLPWDAQVDINLPYDYLTTSNTTRALGVGLKEQSATSWLLGQPSITLDKFLVREGSWRPNLVASVGWLSNIGRQSNSTAIGGGFNQVAVTLNASKRQDPLVFTGSFRYAHSFPESSIAPGDTYTAATSVLFAVSPETSLSVGPQLEFLGKTEASGVRVPGSEAAVSLFQAGLFTNLAPGMALDMTAGIGAGSRAPRYVFQVALPIQF
ncbi:hypothetical protein GCM10011611_27480 [Aliidongia dinghuensis]|uniref:Uncharacterized protein n=1 Tax=Aliidongia dinghuensis TaxID=1867774 RepID=A0A8J2YTR8_9PROT|nr:hypothetical protein [Aliidongia dinghuensis]GGF19983.1 hypothetical protein GCM10011611_27480 [Aliidongia dinghuensis]